MRRHAVYAAFAVALASVVALLSAGTASAQLHGLGVAKGCAPTTAVFGAYSCQYLVVNNVDSETPQNSYSFSSVVDTVHAASGDVPSGNLIGMLEWVAFNGATCTGGVGFGGTGTPGDPYHDVTSCSLPGAADPNAGPFAAVLSNLHSFYTVQPADYNLPCQSPPESGCTPSNTLTDTATVAWTDTTISASGSSQGVGQTTVTQNQSTTSTTINPGAVVEAGSSVSDNVTVTGVAGQPNPTGTVRVDFFHTGDCSGNAADTTTATLDANGQALNVLPETNLAAGLYGYEAHYLGDPANPAYSPSDGACEPLQVVDANIQISPPTATNPVGTNHTLTGHVNVNDGLGGGFVNAPDGTTITFSIQSGPGSFVGGVNSCQTSGGTGSCTVQITSTTAGTTVIRDSTSVSVSGLLLTRASGDANAGDSADAQKVWINPDANIQISPPTATNPVGTNHTLTGHVNVNDGLGGGFVNAPDGTTITFSIQSGPGSFVGGVNSCQTSGGTGSCTVQITSTTAGTTVVRAATDVTVSGVSLHRETGDANAGDSADAQKTWTSAAGRMTGGGSVFTSAGIRVTHGFELHCDPTALPNNLEINWDGGNNFHLVELTSVSCIDDPAITPNPPNAGFDTYIATGTGLLNQVPGATIEFTLTDAGEPGTKDTATFVIKDANGNVVLTVSGELKKGNQQAHAV